MTTERTLAVPATVLTALNRPVSVFPLPVPTTRTPVPATSTGNTSTVRLPVPEPDQVATATSPAARVTRTTQRATSTARTSDLPDRASAASDHRRVSAIPTTVLVTHTPVPAIRTSRTSAVLPHAREPEPGITATTTRARVICIVAPLHAETVRRQLRLLQ